MFCVNGSLSMKEETWGVATGGELLLLAQSHVHMTSQTILHFPVRLKEVLRCIEKNSFIAGMSSILFHKGIYRQLKQEIPSVWFEVDPRLPPIKIDHKWPSKRCERHWNHPFEVTSCCELVWIRPRVIRCMIWCEENTSPPLEFNLWLARFFPYIGLHCIDFVRQKFSI